jgi:hypothetical protein
MSQSEAEQAALVRALIDQARRLGLIWTMRYATVVDGSDSGHIAVRFDGDTEPSYDIISIVGILIPDERVMIASVPPAGQYVIGKLTTPGYIIEAGIVTITPVANTPTSQAVVFTQPFTDTPVITATANTSVPGSSVTEVSISSPTSTGFNAVIYRQTAVATGIHWHAIQMLT